MSDYLVKVMYAVPYITMATILIGIISQLQHKKNYLFTWGIFYFLSNLTTEIIAEFNALLPNGSNLFVVSIYSFISFTFITYLYLIHFYNFSKKKVLGCYFLSLIPVIIQFVAGHESDSYYSYDRVFYAISLMLISLTDIYFIVAGNVKYSASRLFLAYTILAFYSLETMVSLPTNFLINGNIELTVWIWFLRALALQGYYVALIIFIKNSGRHSSSFLLGSR